MKKYYILALLLVVIILSWCSNNELLEKDIEYMKEDIIQIQNNMYWVYGRLDNLESIVFNTGVKKDCWNEEYKGNINFEQSPEYCHKHNDIKLWDNVYFAYLGNWGTDHLKKQEWIKTVTVDGVEWYYDIQPVVEILWETIEWKNCITMINWYWTEPQKTYKDMIEKIKDYIDCLDYWCWE